MYVTFVFRHFFSRGPPWFGPSWALGLGLNKAPVACPPPPRPLGRAGYIAYHTVCVVLSRIIYVVSIRAWRVARGAQCSYSCSVQVQWQWSSGTMDGSPIIFSPCSCSCFFVVFNWLVPTSSIGICLLSHEWTSEFSLVK
jgi:hypothetical protein